MSKQIAVRLPEEIVEFIDESIRAGHASSRAQLVAQALRREQRRAGAARDAEILAREGDDPDMQALAEYMAGEHPALD